MMVLKYSESYSGRSKKFGTGFYVLIACCLLIVGGASWFALSNYADDGKEPPVSSDRNNSYRQESSSYNENTTYEPREPQLSESVAQSAEDVPYTSEEVKQESQSFMMPVEGDIIKDYSAEQLQYSATYGDMRIHGGVDIACKNGTSVSACGNGSVKAIENSASFGTVVVIEHSNGITVRYSSLKDLQVKFGDKVKMGDIIGTVTTVPSECNDKEHLHIEATKNGKEVSPLEAMGLK
ncbi:MAG: M23 family metallopeptidase [Ruminococcaceae bacterium]|nr:M23 family metallopeptidase [Oscillospiraceae bacterium]